MLTPRESASSVYTAARSMGTGKVRGADQDEVTRARIAFLDLALSVVDRAVGSQRLLVREPDDETLASMQRWLTARRELLETPAI